jgi:adenosine deaminase
LQGARLKAGATCGQKRKDQKHAQHETHAGCTDCSYWRRALPALADACVRSDRGQGILPPKGTAEQRAARAYEAARANPLDLEAFLRRMPKGADLHYHFPGGIYAETWIRDAAEDGLCVDLASHAFVKPQPVCGAGQAPAARAFTDQALYDTLINAFSMRSFVPTPGFSGHDQFFATFYRFTGPNQSHAGEWLDEVASRAAAQNEQYLELMDTPEFSHAARIAHEIGWKEDFGSIAR